MTRLLSCLVCSIALAAPAAQARTVYRCMRDGVLSLSTAPEPGSKCEPQQIDDNAALVPNLWGVNGQQKGMLYSREQDGRIVYGTRALPGSTPVLTFAVTPPMIPPHPGLGFVSTPRTDVYAPYFAAAAQRNRIDDAWLRAVAHAESAFRANAVSPKGARGVMQLMPATATAYQVKDPFSPRESIGAGAKLLAALLERYDGDRTLATAAYNAGTAAVARYKGVPPYAETKSYVAKVEALYGAYQLALAKKVGANAKAGALL
jgi:hypothetical protein